jgi:hypothetical protein
VRPSIVSEIKFALPAQRLVWRFGLPDHQVKSAKVAGPWLVKYLRQFYQGFFFQQGFGQGFAFRSDNFVFLSLPAAHQPINSARRKRVSRLLPVAIPAFSARSPTPLEDCLPPTSFFR